MGWHQVDAALSIWAPVDARVEDTAQSLSCLSAHTREAEAGALELTSPLPPSRSNHAPRQHMPKSPKHPTPLPHLTEPTDVDYSSDTTNRSDFLPHTPCPTFDKPPRETRTTSRFFQDTNEKKQRDLLSVCRKLKFHQSPIRAKSNATSVLQPKTMAVKAPEYAPSHRWTDEEREILCVLWRWYSRTPINFAAIWNHVFGQQLSIATIRRQFEDHLRFYGPSAFLVYKDVFSVPFDDPAGTFTRHRALIEATATRLNITLHRLQTELVSPTGKARSARSPSIRKTYKSLVRRASQEEKARAFQDPDPKRAPISNLGLGRTVLCTNPEMQDSEHFVTSEDPPSIHLFSLHHTMSTNSAPALGFRVWSDSNSGTKFTKDRGFIAGAMEFWNGPELPPPFDYDEPNGRRIMQLQALTHFYKCQVPSSFVSVFSSLLEALVKAATMSRPHISMIDLTSQSLQVPNKVLPASVVLKDLQAQGQVLMARTKHRCEYLVFAGVDSSAIIQHFSLLELILLADSNDQVAKLLRLYEFQSGRNTPAVAAKLGTGTDLDDIAIAKAMASVSRKLGLVQPKHIYCLIARLVDGFSIVLEGNISAASRAFATEFKSSQFSLDQIASAFAHGYCDGYRSLQAWEQRRSSKRRRNQKA
ncbi:hypothetical protein ACEQ8H_002618 [Pleosporales sp. CAS-2024a]